MGLDSPVGVVGSGSMAAGIAQLLALAGFPVRLHPGDAATLQTVRLHLDRLLEKQRLDRQQHEAAVSAISATEHLQDLADCGLVIESRLGDRTSTQACIRSLEDVLATDAVIALNTSAHPVSVLASDAKHPQRVAGLHFFEPAVLMRVVEVIAGLRTDPEVLKELTNLVQKLGHAPIAVRDSPGFVVNHVGRALLVEGARVVAENVTSPAVVDRICRETLGFRMGPFELLDLIGLDVSLPVMEQLYTDFQHEPRLRPPTFLSLRKAAGLLGRRQGGAFSSGAPAAPVPPIPLDGGTWPKLWLAPGEPWLLNRVRDHLQGLDVVWDGHARPSEDALCIVVPLGHDASFSAAQAGLDPARTVAVDAVSGLSPLATLMAPPGLLPEWHRAASSVFGAAGAVEWIADSPGFVAQRILAAVVNMTCEVAQQNLASPQDIDRAVRLALGYPKGPLAWGDQFGAARVQAVLLAQGIDADPRDRPSRWLRRRAELNLSLLAPDR
jgi:3-hydroxybutyryl-CoA dehydrogenase